MSPEDTAAVAEARATIEGIKAERDRLQGILDMLSAEIGMAEVALTLATRRRSAHEEE